jgi:DIS3-like exonuclease 2
MWRLTPKGEILDEWFGRTVIRSCSKMPYDVAQEIIEGKIKKHWSDSGADKIFKNLGPTGDHQVEGIVQDILDLHSIASHLRAGRYDVGTLLILE